MSVKVVSTKVERGETIYIYYLNLTEPRSERLYMAVTEQKSITVLTVYNEINKQYEEVTPLFHPQYLEDLSKQLFTQLGTVPGSFARAKSL